MPTALVKILQHILHVVDESSIAYRKYIDAGKTYSHAKELMKCNTQMIALLNVHRKDFDMEGQEHVDALMHHYSVWKSKWLELDATKTFNEDDEFAFPNAVTFPKSAAAWLEEKLKSLRVV